MPGFPQTQRVPLSSPFPRPPRHRRLTVNYRRNPAARKRNRLRAWGNPIRCSRLLHGSAIGKLNSSDDPQAPSGSSTMIELTPPELSTAGHNFLLAVPAVEV